MGVVFFSIGIVAVCLGLVYNSIYGASGSEFLAPSVWHLIWGGVLFLIIGIVFLLPESKDSKGN